LAPETVRLSVSGSHGSRCATAKERSTLAAANFPTPQFERDRVNNYVHGNYPPFESVVGIQA
jgi:hypothetical protein